jgi:hypothetical protein
MMPKEMGGVVSDRLVVHGTKNLRVVDASIFPMIQKRPFVSLVYAVAEKGADIISAIWEWLLKVTYRGFWQDNYYYYYSLLNVRFGSLLGPRGLLLIYMWGEYSVSEKTP